MQYRITKSLNFFSYIVLIVLATACGGGGAGSNQAVNAPGCLQGTLLQGVITGGGQETFNKMTIVKQGNACMVSFESYQGDIHLTASYPVTMPANSGDIQLAIGNQNINCESGMTLDHGISGPITCEYQFNSGNSVNLSCTSANPSYQCSNSSGGHGGSLYIQGNFEFFANQYL